MGVRRCDCRIGRIVVLFVFSPRPLLCGAQQCHATAGHGVHERLCKRGACTCKQCKRKASILGACHRTQRKCESAHVLRPPERHLIPNDSPKSTLRRLRSHQTNTFRTYIQLLENEIVRDFLATPPNASRLARAFKKSRANSSIEPRHACHTLTRHTILRLQRLGVCALDANDGAPPPHSP